MELMENGLPTKSVFLFFYNSKRIIVKMAIKFYRDIYSDFEFWNFF